MCDPLQSWETGVVGGICKRMNIAAICHYFSPEVGAPSARIHEMARVWAAEGHSVTVVTNFPNHPTGRIYDGYRDEKFMVEVIDGITIVRCRTYATPNCGILKKTFAHLYFMVMAVVQGGPNIKGADVIMVSSPTLFSVVSAWWLASRMKIPYVFDVRDLWPGIFVELGVLKNRLVIWTLERLELFLYRKASGIVTVTRAFAEDIRGRGISGSKIHFIPNGVDIVRYLPMEKDASLGARLGLAGKFNVLYCGAHGISQALKSIVDAADVLQGEGDIHFLFVGDGAERDAVMAHASSLRLKNVTFLPSQPKDEIPAFYNLADVCLVPLRNIPLFKTFIPSKMFEMMGCACPIVASVEGECAEILRESGSAIIVPPENSGMAADAILKLKNDAGLRRKMGEAGRGYVMRHFDRDKLGRDYLDIFKSVVR